MSHVLAAAASHGQGLRQVGELLLAFALSSVIGIERQFRGKSAGLRTQAIVGTASALILLVSKYGFGDVLADGRVVLDPSRVAAQIVSGIGFLGAGLIITRRGAIRGLTTAASVWETAAIGMAAGAGLPLLALVVTGLHFVIVIGYSPLSHLIATHGYSERGFVITYEDGRGILRDLLATCTAHDWTVNSMAMVAREGPAEGGTAAADGLVTVSLVLRGPGAAGAAAALAGIAGVVHIDSGEDDDE
ncbi:MgtC/SapB family protein [uncultured Jatrophihabitans sp.]|uniref:MgtC/SapB family protein n=1 Tax=uncultured Jatrophihabitans sp. TaxID=1610747 RepID=UPI0035CB98DB